ncbi:hypothetical protein ACTHQF_06715 [Pedobacter sp. SAFR-022]|uniref:hypothetical protein n=1 Tax=Pedobacter sp. SAFR-022 TaxID=3436861 RepID=UPI003F807039
MKKLLFLLMIVYAIGTSCKKSDENPTVPIDMTLNTYSADAKFGSLPVVLQLRFQQDGTVQLNSFPDDDVVTLKYDIKDRNASSTTLRIYGVLDKTLYANKFTKGTSLDWQAEIGRLSYNAEIVGFTAGEYHFTSY